MFACQITQHMLDEAAIDVQEFNDAFAKNPNFTGGDSRLCGFVAEKVVLHFFPTATVSHSLRYDFDIVAHCGTIYQLGEHHINVKSNKYHYLYVPPLNYKMGVISAELPKRQIAHDLDLVFVKISLNRLIAPGSAFPS